nr:dipeptidase PepV [Risungbinella massiliensis]
MQINWRQEVEKRKEGLFQDLFALLSIESTLDEENAKPGAPFGPKVAEALDSFLHIGKRDGFVTKNVDGYAGHIEHGQGEGLIGVLAHVDVVPANEGWTSPAFAPEIREGKLYARGAVDDKGPAMAAYYGMKIVQELGLPLSKRVRLILGADEESKWRCVEHYFQVEEKPEAGFTPDADFPLIAAEKGFYDIQSSGSLEPAEAVEGQWLLQSFEAGQRVNMVSDQVVASLVGDGDVFELKEQFQDFLLTNRLQGYATESDEDVKFFIRGRGHHGSEPEKGLNAPLELARFLQTVFLDAQGKRYIEMMNDLFVDSFAGEKLGIVAKDSELGDLTVNAGVFSYTQGVEQKLRINIRYPLSADGGVALETIRQKLATYGLQVGEVDHKKGLALAKDHPLVATLQQVYEEHTGDRSKPLAIGGATYARAVENCVAFGPVFPGKLETAHQTDEFIEVEDLLRATAIYAQAIYELAK